MAPQKPVYRTVVHHRALAFGLSAIMTFSVLAGLGQVADREHRDALYALSAGSHLSCHAAMAVIAAPLA